MSILSILGIGEDDEKEVAQTSSSTTSTPEEDLPYKYIKSKTNGKTYRINKNRGTGTNERGMIDRIFGTLGYTGVVEGLYNMTDKDPTSTFGSGLKEGLHYMNPFTDDVSERHLFSDVLENAGWEDNPDSKMDNVARGVAGFLGDVLLDPITFINPYSSAAKIVKGSGVGLDAAKQLTSATKIRRVSDAIQAVKTGKVSVSDKTRMLTGISDKDAMASIRKYYASNNMPDPAPEIIAREAKNLQRTYDEKILRLKQGGQDLEFGFRNMPGAKKMGLDQFNLRLAKADTLRNLGDNTIAPYYNTLMKSLRNSRLGKKFNEFADLEALAKKDPLAAATHSHLTNLIDKYSERILVKGSQDISDAEWLREYLDEIGPEAETELRIAYENGTLSEALTLREFLADNREAITKQAKTIQDKTNSMIGRLDSKRYMDNLMRQTKLNADIDYLKGQPERDKAKLERLIAERDALVSELQNTNYSKVDKYYDEHQSILNQQKQAKDAFDADIQRQFDEYKADQDRRISEVEPNPEYVQNRTDKMTEIENKKKGLVTLQKQLGELLEERKLYQRQKVQYGKNASRNIDLLKWERGEYDNRFEKWLKLDDFDMRTKHVKPSVVKFEKEVDEVTDEVIKTVDLDDDAVDNIRKFTQQKATLQRALDTGVYQGKQFDNVIRGRIEKTIKKLDREIQKWSPNEVVKEKVVVYKPTGYDEELEDFVLNNRFGQSKDVVQPIPTGEIDKAALDEISKEAFVNPEEKVRFVNHINEALFNGRNTIPKDVPDQILIDFYKAAKGGDYKNARKQLANFVAMQEYDTNFFRRVCQITSNDYFSDANNLKTLYDDGIYRAPKIKSSLSKKTSTVDYTYKNTVDNYVYFRLDSGKHTYQVMRDGKLTDVTSNIGESYKVTMPYSEVPAILQSLKQAIANGQDYMSYGAFDGVSVRELMHNLEKIAANLGAPKNKRLSYLESINPKFFSDFESKFDDIKQDFYDYANGTSEITDAKRKTKTTVTAKTYDRPDTIYDEGFDRTKIQNEYIEDTIPGEAKPHKTLSYTGREGKLGDNERIFGEGWEEVFIDNEDWIYHSIGDSYKNLDTLQIKQFKRLVSLAEDELFGLGGALVRQSEDPYKDIIRFADKMLGVKFFDGQIKPIDRNSPIDAIRGALDEQTATLFSNKRKFEQLSFDDAEKVLKEYSSFYRKRAFDKIKDLNDKELTAVIEQYKDSPIGDFYKTALRGRQMFRSQKKLKEAQAARKKVLPMIASGKVNKKISDIDFAEATIAKLEKDLDHADWAIKTDTDFKKLLIRQEAFTPVHNRYLKGNITKASNKLAKHKLELSSNIYNPAISKYDLDEAVKMIDEIKSVPPNAIEDAINAYQKELDNIDWEMSPEVLVDWKDVLSEDMGTSLDRLNELMKFSEDDKAMEFYKFFNDRMNEIGEAEVKAGRLKQDALDAMRGRYMPHIVTEEAKEFFTKMWNPDDNGKYNPKVLGLQKAFDQHRKFHSIDEANEYLAEKNLFKQHGVKKVFETNMAEIYMQRSLGSNKLLFGDEVTSYIKNELSTPFNGTRTHDKVVIHYEDMQKLIKKRLMAEKDSVIGSQFTNKLESKANVYAKLGLDERFIGPNMPFIELTDDQIKIMQDINVSPKDMKLYNMHDTVYDRVNQMSRTQEQMLESDMLMLFDKLQGHWKLWNTVISPGFHSQNAVSNAFQSFLAVGTDAVNPKKLKRAYDIMRTADFKQTVTLGGKKYTYKELKWLAAESGVLDNTFFRKDLTQDLHEFLPYKMGTKVGTNIEGVQRFNLFLSFLDEGKTVNEAVDGVNQFLFDYADLTDFERKVMRRIIPFYTFMRKNIPLELNQMLEKPQTFKAFERAFDEMQNNGETEYLGENERNEWRQEYIQFPFDIGGKTYGISDQLPYNQFERVFEPEKLFGQTSPFIKAPIEALTGEYSYTQMPIESTSEYMMNQTWPTKVANMRGKQDPGAERNLYILGQILGFPIGQINSVKDNYYYMQR